jgi:hypothetical protein
VRITRLPLQLTISASRHFILIHVPVEFGCVMSCFLRGHICPVNHVLGYKWLTGVNPIWQAAKAGLGDQARETRLPVPGPCLGSPARPSAVAPGQPDPTPLDSSDTPRAFIPIVTWSE